MLTRKKKGVGVVGGGPSSCTIKGYPSARSAIFDGLRRFTVTLLKCVASAVSTPSVDGRFGPHCFPEETETESSVPETRTVPKTRQTEKKKDRFRSPSPS